MVDKLKAELGVDTGAHNNECVKVTIRCRPMNEKEQAQGHTQTVRIDKARGEVFVAKPYGGEAPKQFTFDLAYGVEALQETIYTEAASPIIGNVLEGYNGTVFAYGQTGTGKTHTMMGVPDVPDLKGIMPRAFEDIFTNIKADSD